MTPEAQRIAIAEACGWKDCGTGIFGITKDEIVGFNPDRPAKYWPREELPDYLNDLNAMHEVEMSLSAHQSRWFCNHMREFCTNDGAISASADTRARCFLRTLNLLDDSK